MTVSEPSPTSAPSNIAIVIPCYNESATLAPIVRICSKFGTVMVVDDGSSDGSDRVAREAGGLVLQTAGRTGYDGAIEYGLRAAYDRGFDIVITLDADGEHDPELVADFIAAHAAGADLVVGIRPRPQRLAEWLVCGYCNWRYGIKDILCGMKGLTRPALSLYFADGRPNLVHTWPALLWRAQGGAVTQIHVTGTARLDQPRFQSVLKANFRIACMLGTIARLPHLDRTS